MKQYIYGRNTVNALLKGDKMIDEVWFSASLKGNDMVKLCQKRDIPYSFVSNKTVFEKMVGKANHQGVVAKIEGYDYVSLETLLDHIDREYPLLLILDGLEDPHNLGAILRTCDAIGVDGVILPKHRSVQLNETVAKVSTGAIEYVPVCQVTNLTRTIETLKQKGYWIVACDNHESTDYRCIDYRMPLAVVMGSEGFGISPLVLKHCDYHVVLPMIGHVSSLNVSVATALILYQIYQSRHPL